MPRSYLFLLLLSFACIASSAQEGTHCVLPVNVLNAESEFVSDVSAENLTLRVGTTPIKLRSIEKHVTSNVVLLLDSSRQLGGDNNRRNRQLLLLYWLAASAPADVSLVAYTGKVDAILQGRDKVLAELKNRGAKQEILGGDSAVMSALAHTAAAMQVKPGDVIFAIGPAFKPLPKSDRQPLLNVLQRRGIRLFYMQFNFPYQRRVAPELRKETKLSGGAGFIWPEDDGPKSTIEELRDRLVNEMYRYYLVGFDWPAGASGDETMELQFQNATQHSATTLLYPAKPVCSPDAK